MQHRGDELNLLLHSLRKLHAFLVLPLGEFESLEPLVDAPVCLFAIDVLQLGEKSQLIANFHFLIEASLLGQVTDAIL